MVQSLTNTEAVQTVKVVQPRRSHKIEASSKSFKMFKRYAPFKTLQNKVRSKVQEPAIIHRRVAEQAAE
jgi:hypothetical protein